VTICHTETTISIFKPFTVLKKIGRNSKDSQHITQNVFTPSLVLSSVSSEKIEPHTIWAFSTRFLIHHQASRKKRQNYRAVIVNYGPETTDGEILASETRRLSSRKAKENMCDGNKCDRQALDT